MPKLITTKEFISKSTELHKGKYNYQKVNYINNITSVIISCYRHGDFNQTPAVHLRGGGCNLCNLEKRSILNRSNNLEFINKSNNLHEYKYDYSKVNYINNKTPVIIICREHGEFKQDPRSHISGKSGCPTCANKNINTNIFIKKCIEIHGNYYDYSMVEYKDSKNKVKIICPKGHIFDCSPGNHKMGTGCPTCRESMGEREIRKYLELNKIEYKREKRFFDCKYIRTLPFDFYLPNYNMCIEYDGEQHFKKFRFEVDDTNLKFRILKDNIKTNYCEKNNITLIRISYMDNIISKLDSYMKSIV